MITILTHHPLRINTHISCLLTRKADPKVSIAAPLVLNLFNVFARRVHKLKQCTNRSLHDENYTSFVVSLLVQKVGGGEGRGGLLIRGEWRVGQMCHLVCMHTLSYL